MSKLIEGQNDALIQHTASGGNTSPILEFTPHEKDPQRIANTLYKYIGQQKHNIVFGYHEWWQYLVDQCGFEEDIAQRIVKDAWDKRNVQNDNYHKQLVARLVADAQKELQTESKMIKLNDLLNEHILGDLPSDKMPKMRMNPMHEQHGGHDEWKLNIDKMKEYPGVGYAEVTVPVGGQEYLRGLEQARELARKDLSRKLKTEIAEDAIMVWQTNSVMDGTDRQIITILVKPIGDEELAK